MGNDETVTNDVLVTPDITSMAPCKCLRPGMPTDHEIALTEFTFILAKYIRYLKLCKGESVAVTDLREFFSQFAA